MEAAAAKLMDFSQPMDVALLDQVVTTAFDASHPQVREKGDWECDGRRPREMPWTAVHNVSVLHILYLFIYSPVFTRRIKSYQYQG